MMEWTGRGTEVDREGVSGSVTKSEKLTPENVSK